MMAAADPMAYEQQYMGQSMSYPMGFPAATAAAGANGAYGMSHRGAMDSTSMMGYYHPDAAVSGGPLDSSVGSTGTSMLSGQVMGGQPSMVNPMYNNMMPMGRCCL